VLFVVVWTLEDDAIHEPEVVVPISAYWLVAQEPFVPSVSSAEILFDVPASMKNAARINSPTFTVEDAPVVSAVPVAPAAFAPLVRTVGVMPLVLLTSVSVQVFAVGEDPKFTVMTVPV
jgi:hypothetical protein